MNSKPAKPTTFADALAARAGEALAGRPRPFLIAICGGADTGKSTVAQALCDIFGRQNLKADWLSTDTFLMDRRSRHELGVSGFNPASVDMDAMVHAIEQLSSGVSYTCFPYVNQTGTHASEPRLVEAGDIVVVEGIHALDPAVATRMDYRLFIDAPADVLRELRVRANRAKRGMDAGESMRRVDFEMEEFARYTAPAKRWADGLISVSRSYDYDFAGPASPTPRSTSCDRNDAIVCANAWRELGPNDAVKTSREDAPGRRGGRGQDGRG